MKVYERYILSDLLKINCLLLFIFFSFYLLIDFFEKLGAFLSFKKPFYLFLTYIFWKSLVNLYEIFPFVCGFSGIILLLWLVRTGEFIAFLSLGFSKNEIISLIGKGILFFGMVIGILLNIIFPKAAFLSLYTWDYKIAEKREQYLIFNKQIFIRGADFYLVAKPLEPKGEYLGDILIVFLKGENLNKVIWAKKGYYKGKNWILKDVIIQKKEENFSPKFFKTLKTKLSFTPKTLVLVEKPLNFLSLGELIERYKFLRMVNRPYSEVIAEIFLKIVYIFLPLFFSLFSMMKFVEDYTPARIAGPFLKGLMVYFSALTIYLFLQAFLRKGVILADVLLGICIVMSLLTLIYIWKKK